MGYGWGGNFAKDLYFLEYKKGNRYVYSGQQEYSLFPFKILESGNSFAGSAYKEIYNVGYTNTVDSILIGEPSFPLTKISGQNANNKHKDKPWIVTLPNGTERTYIRIQKHLEFSNCKIYRYVIHQEKLPDGLIRHYSYFKDSNTFKKIWVTNSDSSRVLDELDFTYEDLSRSIRLSDGREVGYSMGKVPVDNSYPGKIVFGLKLSNGNHLLRRYYQQTIFDYGDYDHFKISKVSFNYPENSGVIIDYYEDKK